MAKANKAVARIETVGDLLADPLNARGHNPENVGLIADALQEVGAARSIVIDEAGVILAGEGVTEAAAQVGMIDLQVVDASGDEIVAVRRTGLTPAQKTRLALFDNRAGERSSWRPDVLQALAELGRTEGIFDAEELAAIAAAFPADPVGGTGVHEPTPPDAFASVDEVETDYRCPACGYEWAGAAGSGDDDEV